MSTETPRLPGATPLETKHWAAVKPPVSYYFVRPWLRWRDPCTHATDRLARAAISRNVPPAVLASRTTASSWRRRSSASLVRVLYLLASRLMAPACCVDSPVAIINPRTDRLRQRLPQRRGPVEPLRLA